MNHLKAIFSQLASQDEVRFEVGGLNAPLLALGNQANRNAGSIFKLTASKKMETTVLHQFCQQAERAGSMFFPGAFR